MSGEVQAVTFGLVESDGVWMVIVHVTPEQIHTDGQTFPNRALALEASFLASLAERGGELVAVDLGTAAAN